MLKFELVQNDKHSTNDLLRQKNLRFSSRTNLIKVSWQTFKATMVKIKKSRE
jgi:hypothetical protein